MEIKISDGAKNYLLKNNKKVVTIDLHGSGCCVEIFVPTLTMDYPKDLNGFDRYLTDGIEIFLYKGARAKKNTITIILSRFLLIKSLDVTGLDLT